MAIGCNEIIKEALGLTDVEAKQVIRDLEQKLAANEFAKSNPEALAELIEQQASEYKRQAKMATVRAQKTAIRLAEANTLVRQFKNVGDGMMAFLTGHTRFATVTGKVEGGLNSVAAHQRGMVHQALSGFFKDLEAGGEGITSRDFRKLLRDKPFNDMVARELFAIADGKSVTANADAYRVAQAIEKHKEILRKLANLEGADIAKLPAHVVMQSHDAAKLVKAGYETWKNTILPRLDLEKTFKGSDPEEVLRSVYDKILRNEQGFYQLAEEGASNLASRLSKRRYFQFKGVDDWLAYHEQFGVGSVIDGTLHSFRNNAKAVATMQRMGPDPAMFFRKMMAEQTKAGIAMSKPLSGGYGGALENTYSALTGGDMTPGSVSFAQFAQGFLTMQTLAKLGGSMLSSFSDLNSFAAAQRYNGVGWLEGYGNAFQSLFRGMPKGADKEVASYLATFSDGLMASVAHRMGADDSLPGTMSKMSDLYFKMNGLTGWTDRLKMGHAWSLSRLLAREQGTEWGALDKFMQSNLMRYGINAEDWKGIQKAVAGDLDGVKYLTPDLIKDEKLAQKLRTWQVNESEFGVPTPGVRERAIALQGTRPGTVTGEIMRALAQFKMFSLTQMTRGIPRAWDMGVPGVVNLAVMGTAFGYLSTVAKDMAMGKKPRDPTQLSTWQAAFLTGGGAGLLGDAVFSDFSAYGRSVPEYVGGPAASFANDLARIYSKSVRGEDPQAAAVKFLYNNTPFANLFYTKAALNYLVLHTLQEKMNPGYLTRMQRRMERETGQSYMFNPSEYLVPGMVRR